MRQGPHHTAQKSPNTGLSDDSTNSLKLLSVITCALVLVLFSRYCSFASKATNLTGWQTGFGFYSFNLTLRQAAVFLGLFVTSL